MLTRSRILLYWLLLLVPTLVLGIWGWQLLVREEERIVQASELARLDRFSLTVENIDLFLDDAKGALIEGLIALPDTDVEATMATWQEDNPLVRQTFIWRPGQALVFPNPDNPGSESARQFLQRFGSLLNQPGPWPRYGSALEWENDEPLAEPLAEPPKQDPQKQEPPPEQAPSPRKEVQQWAQQDRYAQNIRARGGAEPPAAETFAPEPAPTLQRQKHGDASIAEAAPGEAFFGEAAFDQADAPGAQTTGTTAIQPTTVTGHGWIPWNRQNEWSALGWIELSPSGEIRGAELRMEAITSRLQTILNDSTANGEVLVLHDGNGQTISISGGNPLPGNKPAHILSINPLLPGWQLAVHSLPGNPQETGGFLLISLLLLGVFLVAILSGGSLLLWQAHRNALDARRKSGFVSNVSHELKTPLTTLRIYADLLSDSPNTSETKRHHYLDVIRSETDRLTRLVNNVLDFSRLERKQKSYRKETFDAAAAIGEILDHQQPWIRKAGLELSFDTPDQELPVEAERDSIEQVCINLIDNAAKYAADGGKLDVTTTTENGHVRIDFMDRGPGIPQSHRRRIFEEFHRIDDSLTSTHPGCGLGLSIARQLLRSQNGDLTYSPRPGGGSIFSITIPLSKP